MTFSASKTRCSIPLIIIQNFLETNSSMWTSNYFTQFQNLKKRYNNPYSTKPNTQLFRSLSTRSVYCMLFEEKHCCLLMIVSLPSQWNLLICWTNIIMAVSSWSSLWENFSTAPGWVLVYWLKSTKMKVGKHLIE